MRRRRDRISNVQAGVIALVLVVIGSYLGFTKGNIPFVGGGYQVEAVFPSAASEIRKGSPVRIAGVNVGKVTKVSRGPGTTALVRMRLDDAGRPLHRDATAKIRPRLFLEGNFFVDLTAGSPGAPEIDDGGTIPLSQTKIPVQVDDVLDTLTADSREDLRRTVKGLAGAFSDGGGTALRDLGQDGPAALANTAVVSDAALGERPGELARVVSSTADISSALASREEDLRSLVTAFATTTSTLAQQRGDLEASLTALGSTLRTARPELASIRAALPALTRFAGRLEPSLERLPGAIAALRPFVRQAAGLVSAGELPALTKQLTPAVAALNAAEPDLRGVLAEARPIARCVARNVVPTLNKSVDDGKLSTGMPAWQELAHLGPGLSAAGQSFDGSGGSIRYNFGISENSVATGLTTTLTDALGALGVIGPQTAGARPRWTPNTSPPFNATAPCEKQDLPDLTASSAPAPATRSAQRLNLSTARRSVVRAVRASSRRSAPTLRARLRNLAASPPGSAR
jgi:virulence factor Mce-like protein